MATPKEQLLSRTVYNTNGTTTIWEFAFSGGYLAPAHVKAYTVNAVGTRTDLVINPAVDLVGQFQLRIQPALAAGLELVIYRDTPKNLPLVDFTDESGFSEIALDTNAKQGVFIAAEAIDTVNALDVAAAIAAAERSGISAISAQASQTAAASSANAAANSATAAAGSATASQTAQLAAESARNVASTEAAAAAVSATSANTSRTQAQSSATAAANSATAAGTSATSASASQTAAANSASAAAGSAIAASASQTAAANSATAAANSATAAAGSATSAATSAAGAAASAASINPANLVQVTGDQTIADVKTFTLPPIVPPDSFSFAQLQNIATATILGRNTAGTGDVEALTGAQATTLLSAASETVSGRVELADATEAAAGTDGTRALSPLRLRNALAATGSAPIYACRAWVNFDGTGTVAIRASGNVSSITDNGVGDYTVNFAAAMPDANYCAVLGAGLNGAATTSIAQPHQTVPQTANAIRIQTYTVSGATADQVLVNAAFFR